ncbi:MAG: neutral/alkaline non-lysosomal ceramidase N-terminal domain-containing protein [Chthoniobacteraceae bacterium]
MFSPTRFAIAVALVVIASVARAADAPLDWKAGVASTVITPTEFIWMAGYAGRTTPAVARTQDLFAKALVLQDADGKKQLLVTLDLIGVPRTLRDNLEKRLGAKHGLPREGLLINASHTHCGPEFRVAQKASHLADVTQKEQAEAYGVFLEEKLVALAADAFAQLAPARLEYHHARCGFAMNRRLPVEGGYKNAPYSEGPVDHDVPVLAVFGADAKLRAAVFGYACHSTTMGFNEWCGDYPGYAQEYFQADHPGATALFVAGCGGDQNPYPRRHLPLAQIHGRSLATAVRAALEAPAVQLPARLDAAMEDVQLDFAVPTRVEFESRLKGPDKYFASHAQRMLTRLDAGEALPTHYAYPVQVVRFGGKLTLIALGGEVVVDYSLRFKRELAGQHVWVAGYSNDVMAYIPSLRVLKEGGYEAGDANRYGNLPGPWTASVEERIAGKVHELLARTQSK